MAPTPLYLNGFENRVFAVGGITADGLWGAATLTGITPSADTVHRGSGALSMKCAVPGGGATSQASMQANISAQTKLAYRFYFRKSGDPSQTNSYIALVSPAGSTFFLLLHRTDGALQLLSTGGTSPTNGGVSSVLNNDQWYLIDVTVDVSTTSYVARLFIDGTQVSGDATITGAAAGSLTRVNIGKVQSGTNTTAFDLFFDDFIIGTAADLTDTFGATDGIVALLPDGDGTHSPSPPTAGRFKDVGGTDISGSNPAWDNVDSGDLTQTAERISQPVAAASEYLEITMGTATLSASAPVAVQGEVGLNTDGTNAFTAKSSVYNGSTENVIFNGDWSIAAGTKVYKRALVTVANQSELDGLKWRIGFGSSQPATPYWEALMVEVDIGISTGASETPTPGGAAAGGTAPGPKASLSPGGAAGQGVAPGAAAPVSAGSALGQGTGPLARVDVGTRGPAVAGGTAPSEPGGPVSETPVPGGAAAGGVAPAPRAAAAAGGAAAAGSSPSSRVAVPAGGALGQGAAPAIRVTTPVGGGVGGGVPPAPARVALSPGGALGRGISPTDGTSVSETPTPGGAAAGGRAPAPAVSVVAQGAAASGTSPAARVPTVPGGAAGGGIAPAVAFLVLPGGALAQGRAPTGVRAAFPPGGASAGGQLTDPLEVVLTLVHFGSPSPAGGDGAGSPSAAVFGPPSPRKVP